MIMFFVLTCCCFSFPRDRLREVPETEINLEYTIQIDDADHSHFRIRLRISALPCRSLRLAMTQNYGQVPGLREIIPEIRIEQDGKKCTQVREISEFIWQIEQLSRSDILIDYKVNNRFPYSSLNMVRLPSRNEDHLCFPVASVFVQPEERYLSENKITIKKIRADFELPLGWIAATSWGTNRMSYDLDPPTLDTLNEGLIGLGRYRTYLLYVEGIAVETAILHPETEQYAGEINEAVEKALLAGRELFGFYPLSRFFALIQFVLDKPGQINGVALGSSISLNYGRKSNDEQWIRMKSHIFSEIFHHWNGTEGAPLSRAQNDHSLIWFTEGVTEFYRLKNMLACGLLTESVYFRLLSENYNRALRNPRLEDSLDKISRDYYSDPLAMSLTYNKGCCLAFALDLLIGHISGGEKSLDDLMRTMLDRHDFRVNRRCYSHGELDSSVKEILSEKYYASYKRLYGKGILTEFASVLSRAGLCLEKEQGGRLFFGVTNYSPRSGPPVVLEIDRGSPCYKAGIRENDVLLEINGCVLKDNSDIRRYLEGKSEDDWVELLVERNRRRLMIRTPWISYETKFEIKKKCAAQGHMNYAE